MKHTEIIQANIDKRNTKYEKILYLIYAYKERLIGLLIGTIIILIIAFSFFTKTVPDLSVRVVSDKPVAAESLDTLTTSIKEKDKNIKDVDVQAININDPSKREVLMAQMAAKEIDIFLVPNNPSKELRTLKNQMVEANLSLKLAGDFNDYRIGRAFHAPHLETIKALEKN